MKGSPSFLLSIRGVAFNLKSLLFNLLTDSPVGISDQFMTMRVPQTEKPFVIANNTVALSKRQSSQPTMAFFDVCMYFLAVLSPVDVNTHTV